MRGAHPPSAFAPRSAPFPGRQPPRTDQAPGMTDAIAPRTPPRLAYIRLANFAPCLMNRVMGCYTNTRKHEI